mgnify:CR=1 FL=1
MSGFKQMEPYIKEERMLRRTERKKITQLQAIKQYIIRFAKEKEYQEGRKFMAGAIVEVYIFR